MNILHIYAHLDDETILSYGTLLKQNIDNNVFIVCICGNGRNTINKTLNNLQQKRINSFKKIIKHINCKYKRYEYYDLSLNSNVIKSCLDNITNIISPDVVVTHSKYDLHFEHRLIAEEVMIKFRPNTNVKKIITTVSPTYMWTSQQYGAFNPNMFVDISEYADEKRKALLQYSMELKENSNDNRSVESIMNQNRQYGFQMNTKYCEAYQVLWSKE